MLISVNQLATKVVGNQTVPPEGMKVIPIPLDWSTTDYYELDFSQFQEFKNFSMVQAVFIDNSANGSQVYVRDINSRHTIKCPGNFQGYFTILSQNPMHFEFGTQGNGQTLVYLLNFPVSNALWPAI